MGSGRRLSHFQAHEDMVTCMLPLPSRNRFITASHGGQVSTWTPEWQRLSTIQGPKDCLWHHAAVSVDGRHVVLTGQGHAPAIVLYELDEPDANQTLKLLAHVPGEYTFVEWVNASTIVAVLQPSGQPPVLHVFDSHSLLLKHAWSVRGSCLRMQEQKKGFGRCSRHL